MIHETFESEGFVDPPSSKLNFFHFSAFTFSDIQPYKPYLKKYYHKCNCRYLQYPKHTIHRNGTDLCSKIKNTHLIEKKTETIDKYPFNSAKKVMVLV